MTSAAAAATAAACCAAAEDDADAAVAAADGAASGAAPTAGCADEGAVRRACVTRWPPACFVGAVLLLVLDGLSGCWVCGGAVLPGRRASWLVELGE